MVAAHIDGGKKKARPSAVDDVLLDRAVLALLKHHEETLSGKGGKSKKSSKKKALLGTDLLIQVQIGLAKVPQNPSSKPIRIGIPNPLHQVSGADDTTDGDSDEAEVCIIVKESSKPWVQEMVTQFPTHLGCVKKVLGLESLRKKYKQYEQRRELLRRFDIFMADDRILPMLAKSLGKHFFEMKKQPIPIKLTRKEAFPFAVQRCLRATYMFMSAGTCLTVKAGNTSMSNQKLAENIQSIVENAADKIPKKWANIRSISIKTTESISLPIYNKTPEELAEIARLSGTRNDSKKRLRDSEEENGALDKKEKIKTKELEKSPLVRALKKQKKSRSGDTAEAEGKDRLAVEKSAKQLARAGKESIEAEKPQRGKTPKKRGIAKGERSEKNDGVEITPKSSIKAKVAAAETPKSTKKKGKKPHKEKLEVSGDSSKEKSRRLDVASIETPKSNKKKGREHREDKSLLGADEKRQFIASKKFKGSKKGYVFRTGKDGLGYYVDVKPIVDKMALEALFRAASHAGSARRTPKSGGRRTPKSSGRRRGRR